MFKTVLATSLIAGVYSRDSPHALRRRTANPEAKGELSQHESVSLLGLQFLDNSEDEQLLQVEEQQHASMKSHISLLEQTLSELGRFFNSKDQPIVLSQSHNHARLVLKRQRRHDLSRDEGPFTLKNEEDPEDFLQLTDVQDPEKLLPECGVEGPDRSYCIQMYNDHDMAYMADVYIGTPPQKIRALFDTGSSNTWILNSKVKEINGLAYHSEQSSTSQATAQGADISFGSGSLSGHFYVDDLTIGVGEHAIKIKNQKFGNVEEQAGIFNGGFEAIIGMAYPELAEQGVTPVFDNMMSQQLLKNNMFAFYLTTKQAENMGIQSDLTFGYYDKTKFQGELVWHPVIFKYMFGLKLDDIKINGKSLGFCGPNGQRSECIVTVDSGTTMMSLPGWAFSQIQGKVPTHDTPVTCNQQQQFGELTWVINGHEYVFKPDEWVYPPYFETSLAQKEEEAFSKHMRAINKQDENIVRLGQSSAALAQLSSNPYHLSNEFEEDEMS